ncbi:MAG: GntR family transcriptional regulator [Caulobacteraceae bacterium]|nr:GntR family transcriptional regulator [Caulobacteraceae bacterium]
MTKTAGAKKLYQQVVSALEESIVTGRFKAGDRLPSERELAEDFKVSRPTVREAMLALEIRGLVEARHGSGIYVRETPEQDAPSELDIGAFELTEARLLFEGEAAALAATTISDAELIALEATLTEMAMENEGEYIGEQADRRFHLAIAEATRNSAIVGVVESLWDIRYRSPLCRHMLKRAREVGVKPRIDDHRLLLDALKARDPQRARQAMREHLERVIEAILAATELEAVERAREEVAARRTEYARRRAV